MGDITVCLIVLCSIAIAVLIGRSLGIASSDAEKDVADGKRAEAEARAQALQEEAKRTETAAAIKDYIDESISETSPGMERIRARWDLLHKNPDGGPPGTGNHTK